MFLNGLKAQSIYRKINKELTSSNFRPLHKKIRTVAILQKEGRTFVPGHLKELAKAFSVHEKDVISMTLVEQIEKKDAFETTLFTEKQIGWNGTLKSTPLKDFAASEYDVLINYYDEQELPLVAISAFSKARFKVGFMEELASMNDLVVNVAMTQNDILIKEMIRYMKIIKIMD